jgi:alkyldihydroxyacetonephosphate synthase
MLMAKRPAACPPLSRFCPARSGSKSDAVESNAPFLFNGGKTLHATERSITMTIDRKKLRWNGWGWNEAPDVLGGHADGIWQWVATVMGLDSLPETPARPLEEITLPAIRLSDTLFEALRAIVPGERIKTDDYERAFHAMGDSYHDLIRLRSVKIDAAPDAVVYPVSDEECLAIVRFCAQNRIALIPFGGGSTVVGGVTARAEEGQQGVFTLDMTRMDEVLDIDETAQVALVQAGIYGPALEDALQARGYTLGHYPQSFEFSTLGGWIAPRGAGHQSNKYGKAEEWFVSADVATPSGMWSTEGFPGSAAGPQFRDIIAGSEGAFGVITKAVVKVHPVPEKKDYRGYLFMDFARAVEATRAMMQEGVPTAMIRLSDFDETRFYTALKLGGQEPDANMRFCAMLTGLEGREAEVDHALAWSKSIIESHGGMHMGEELGTSWYKTRFETPYLRDPMMDRGLGVDTLETCTRWSNILHLHDVVTRVIQNALAENTPGGAKGIVMSHISHSYRDGASLYFTFAFARDPGREVEQWRAVKHAASEAILANGGTISHHHGVGEDHLEWIGREKGETGLALLRAMKEKIDPENILNPGKLLP